MPIAVQGPDGQVRQFPDGTPDDQIHAQMLQIYSGGQGAQPAAAAGPSDAPAGPAMPPAAGGAPVAPNTPGQVLSAPSRGRDALISALPEISILSPTYAKYLEATPEYAQAKKSQEIQQRADIARQMGLDPATPTGREYVLTGSIPKFERNFPAIMKAEEDALNADITVDKTNNAIDLNKQTLEGPLTGWQAKLGGWFNADAANATQEYQAIVKLLSQEIAKGLSGGGRVNQFEQKMMSDLLGSIDQPRAVREAIMKDVQGYLIKKRDFSNRKAEMLRNGTYFEPGQTALPNKGATTGPQSTAPKQPLLQKNGFTVEAAD